MPRRPFSAAVPALCALATAGCGQEPAEVTGGVLRITLAEYAITPREIVAPAGELSIIARNTGRVPHNLRVQIPRENPSSPERTIGGTPTAASGRTATATVRLRPGTYRLACTLANHDDLGMRARLRVTAP